MPSCGYELNEYVCCLETKHRGNHQLVHRDEFPQFTEHRLYGPKRCSAIRRRGKGLQACCLLMHHMGQHEDFVGNTWEAHGYVVEVPVPDEERCSSVRGTPLNGMSHCCREHDHEPPHRGSDGREWLR